MEVGGTPTGDLEGCRSRVHYAWFLDKDKERGKGEDADNGRIDRSEDYCHTNSNDNPGALDRDKLVLITCDNIKNFMHIAFCAPTFTACQSREGSEQPLLEVIMKHHRNAMIDLLPAV